MIKFVPGEYSQLEWDALSARATTQNLMQSWAWGEAKKNADGWWVERGVFQRGDEVVGLAQAMLRDLPGIASRLGGGLCWINRAPLVFAGGGDALPELLGALRQHYVVERHFYLRVASPEIAAEEAAVDDAPAGFRSVAAAGWASALLALAPGADALRAGLRPNWRNKLNKAERAGIRIEKTEDEASLLAFTDEYRDFLAARGFTTTVTPDLLRALFRAAAPGAAICYRGFAGDNPLGSIVTIRYGETIEYLVAITQEAARSVPVGQLLVWRAICDGVDAGARQFDVSGMDPETTPKGIYEFKSGLNADPYRLRGEIEAVGGGPLAALVRWRVGRARRAGSD